MQQYTQKYTIVCFEEDLPLSYEFSMENWPSHVTLADVFSIEAEPSLVFEDLRRRLVLFSVLNSKIIAQEKFGEKMTIYVGLIKKTKALINLHTEIINVLGEHGVIFNNPEYMGEGFLPHITLEAGNVFEKDRSITFDSISLVDMFPDDNPAKRKILGTIRF